MCRFLRPRGKVKKGSTAACDPAHSRIETPH